MTYLGGFCWAQRNGLWLRPIRPISTLHLWYPSAGPSPAFRALTPAWQDAGGTKEAAAGAGGMAGRRGRPGPRGCTAGFNPTHHHHPQPRTPAPGSVPRHPAGGEGAQTETLLHIARELTRKQGERRENAPRMRGPPESPQAPAKQTPGAGRRWPSAHSSQYPCLCWGRLSAAV